MPQANITKLALTIGMGTVSTLSLWAYQNSTQSSQLALFAIQVKEAPGQLPEGFVYLADIDPTIQQEVRYAGENNFVGRPIEGYERPVIILTEAAARALATAQATLRTRSKGKYTLRVYDGYRPQRSVDDFWQWSQDLADQKMRDIFYPNIADKRELFQQGYIDKQYSHSRGSTVDLTIVDNEGQEIDMGSPFDLFDTISHYESDLISRQAQENRRRLRKLMVKHGFMPYGKEWWHFTLRDEPFSEAYDFPVR
ncbi:MAG: M15 family metallopeptidase [Roseivirga sp.]